MEISNKYIKMSSARISVPMDTEIEEGERVKIIAEMECVQTRRGTDQEGGIDKDYVLKTVPDGLRFVPDEI